MLIFGLYKSERIPLEIAEGVSVREIKSIISKKLNINYIGGSKDRKILTLSYGGTELADSWILSHLGIREGVTVRIAMREEVKPILYIYCAFNQETINVYREWNISNLFVSDLKTFASHKTGLPVGVFRLLGPDGTEMFDSYTLDVYGLDNGGTVRLVTWDGWNDFLKLATMGYTSHVMSNLSHDEAVARYQMKVAMYVAAHFGHVDLAVCLLRQGIQSDEAIGEHPTRQWCFPHAHRDSFKTPIHVATENEQLGVLRTFTNHNICSIMAKDGDGLMPINIALRRKIKSCASFLLTKQWSRVQINKSQSLPLNIFTKIKNWCNNAKEKVFLLQGHAKSSIRKRHLPNGPLVSYGVNIDGFSTSQMNSKQKVSSNKADKAKFHCTSSDEEDPESYFRRLQITAQPWKLRRGTTRFWKDKTKVVILNERKLIGNTRPPDAEHERGNATKFPLIPTRMKLVNIAHSYTEARSSESQLEGKPKKVPTFEEENINARNKKVTANPVDKSIPRGVGLHDKKTLPPLKVTNAKTASLFKKKMHENSISLPAINIDDTSHPHFIYVDSNKSGNIVADTLMSYEKYRGMRARDYAIECLVIANSFKDKSWLERVRMAVTLNARMVKNGVK